MRVNFFGMFFYTRDGKAPGRDTRGHADRSFCENLYKLKSDPVRLDSHAKVKLGTSEQGVGVLDNWAGKECSEVYA